MKKKLQIFVSSTFSDLIEERQKAVETILRSGNIPAGMELFSAGDKSQLETIKEWILESDVYVLILGGRYGSLEPDTQLSYTEIEYKYASDINKPLFAIVLSEDYIRTKVLNGNPNAVENDNPNKYKSFKEQVLTKICRICKDENEIQLAIFESLFAIQRTHVLTGWIKGDEVPDNSVILKELEALRTERDELAIKIRAQDKISKEAKNNNFIGDFTYDEVYTTLQSKIVKIPNNITFLDDSKEKSVLELFISATSLLTKGLSDFYPDEVSIFYIDYLVPILISFGLVERKNMKNDINTFIISIQGNKFLSNYEINIIKNK